MKHAKHRKRPEIYVKLITFILLSNNGSSIRTEKYIQNIFHQEIKVICK